MFSTIMNTRSMTRNARAIIEVAMTPHSNASEYICDNHSHSHSHKNTIGNFKEKYEVDINFDEASRAWKMNKKSIGCGNYKYTGCIYQFKNGRTCGRETVHDTNYCLSHLARININNQVIDVVKRYVDYIHK